MLTQDVSNELERVLQQLSFEGKEPTVALVKSRLNTVVPIPVLITVIKSWKHSNLIPKVEVAAKNHSDRDKIAQLEKQVTNLTQRIEKLEQKMSNV
ncbi:hypothetical protein [Vibrio hepatarius]|uniref:hypothetical protein n=1 Tax=Vibrio hepatarius TaxID=171383 RepID=UPI001C07F306|nr:hypothetical protein [Vibrio hepatarius]MBU2895764.1 hypothetical protein [Vibrio hepatarius]